MSFVVDVPNPSRADPSQQAGAVVISGDVGTVRTLSSDDLRACSTRTEAVTFRTPTGSESHVFDGCSLEALISAAHPVVEPAAKHPFLTLAVVATGADGYAVTLSWAEISASHVHRPALVAWSQDGVVLTAPRLIVPDDLTGARHVSALIGVRVVQLAGH